MKKCMICVVLMCFALAACAAATNQPTTEPQMNVTTTSSTATTVPPASSTITTALSTTAPVNSSTPTTQITTKPTTKPTTVVTTTKPITSSSKVTQPSGVEKGHLCVYRDDGNCIIPIGGPLVHKTYWEDKGTWATAIYPPFFFKNYRESQIPAIQLVGPLHLELAENMKLTHLEVQMQMDGEGTTSTFQELSNLAPGIYYVRMVIIGTGKYVAGDYETSTYIYGFKLIVPAGFVEQRAGLTGVELTAGSQTVIPIQKMRTTDSYNESTGRWMCALGTGVRFDSLADEEIPVLTLTAAMRISIPENAAFGAIYVQTEKTGQPRQTSLAEMAELTPGTYYVKIGVTHYGRTFEGRRANSYYEYGLKLIIPAT